MLACALCIANPQACPNPEWYTRFCLLLHEMYPVTPEENSSPKMNGLRSRMQQHAQSLATQSDETGQRLPVRQESRATVAMLAPAVHIMHQVWKGMAWVTEGIEEEEEDTRLYEKIELGISNESSSSLLVKRLSTIAESTSLVQESSEMSDEVSSKVDSMNDVIL
ncbi:hypothetical protein DICVIV_00254 [Dictyocaulus viviparus]|uniref:Uncharacterized protein n=1 Tax=Dictyocaulus viviparus TaxID=29172 RepID=A0A0D8YFT1_DICVI|nr:hypothetical protein DICVIV_00254 [Dictyocaulus viviparus]